MSISIENILLIGSFLLLISIIAGKTSYKFGVPTLVLFLVVGMLAGSEGIGGIQFDNPAIARFIGVVSLCFILFSGGMDTHWSTIKPCFWKGFSLSTLGVLLTTVSLGTFVWLVTDFTLYEVLRTLVYVIKQVPGKDGRWFSVRIMPYRTFDDRIEGLVITFIDITNLKQAEETIKLLSHEK